MEERCITHNDQHEVFKDRLKVRISGDGDGDIAACSQECPDETGYTSSPSGEDLHTERHRVNVRAVVGDDRQCEDDQAELTESAQGGKEDSGEQTTDSRIVITVRESGVVDGGGYDGCAEHLGEQKRESETAESRDEDFGAVGATGLVACVVGCVAGPSSCETEDGCSKREDGAGLRFTNAHRQVGEFARVSKFTENDQEDDEAWNPTPELVCMYDLVAEECHDERRSGNNKHTSEARDIRVDGIDQLSCVQRDEEAYCATKITGTHHQQSC